MHRASLRFLCVIIPASRLTRKGCVHAHLFSWPASLPGDRTVPAWKAPALPLSATPSGGYSCCCCCFYCTGRGAPISPPSRDLSGDSAGPSRPPKPRLRFNSSPMSHRDHLRPQTLLFHLGATFAHPPQARSLSYLAERAGGMTGRTPPSGGIWSS